MVLNAAFSADGHRAFGNIALFSAILKAVLLTTNNTEFNTFNFIHLSCIFFKAQSANRACQNDARGPLIQQILLHKGCNDFELGGACVFGKKVFSSSAFKATQCLASPTRKKGATKPEV